MVAREHRPAYDTVDREQPVQRRASRPPRSDRASTATATPERPPHPVEDPAWRYVHDLDEPTGLTSDGPPFGLPVLAEVPALATVLSQLRTADQLLARALEGVLLLQDHADVVAMTGVGLESWLTTIARRTRTDARMLLAAAEMLRRLPSLRAAFQAGQVSWAQVRSVALKARPLPTTLDDRVDAAVASAIDGAGGAEPDALTRVIGWSLAAIHPERTIRTERQERDREFLALQPRLDGSGGRLWGELSATSWAVLDAALHPAGTGATAPDGQDTTTTSDDGTEACDAPQVDPRPPAVERNGRDRARRLIALLETTLPGAGAGSHEPDPGGAGTPRAAGSRPQLLLRADLDTLLRRDETPATLLTTLLGGHVRVSAATARRLVDERGADLRTVVLDDTGSVVGVGRRHRLAPGWLSDAVLALHDTCSAPGCLAAARGADLDHARPWWPARPEDLPGTTDVDEIAPLCPTHNRGKEHDGWTVEQSADGRRRWVHVRSGLTTATVPATWRSAPTTAASAKATATATAGDDPDPAAGEALPSCGDPP
jgi:hypothetical protein